MKNKSFVSVIAILLVLSLIPFAGLAAARTGSCGHGDDIETSWYEYVKINALSHRYVYITESECRECGDIEHTETIIRTEAHVYRLDDATGTEVCKCGATR